MICRRASVDRCMRYATSAGGESGAERGARAGREARRRDRRSARKELMSGARAPPNSQPKSCTQQQQDRRFGDLDKPGRKNRAASPLHRIDPRALAEQRVNPWMNVDAPKIS